MKIHIIIRTHDQSNVHKDWRKRYCNLSKFDIVKGCYISLIKSIQNANDHGIKITILDDHSSDSLISMIHQESHGIDYEFVRLEQSGYNHSAHQQYLRCRDSTADLVYSVEDDYLHCDTAISEMIESYEIFADRIKDKSILLYPFDEPSEYDPPSRADFLVHGSRRHWRTGIFTTNVMMTAPQLFRDHWNQFETLALKYNGNYLEPRDEHYEESNTIWPIWQQGLAVRFNPVPSLALHMQFDQQKDPFIDWEQWWEKYTQ